MAHQKKKNRRKKSIRKQYLNRNKPARQAYAEGLNPDDFDTMSQEDRIAQLMDKQGITREEALANQQASLDKGWDINQDGVVSNQEFIALRDSGQLNQT